MKNLKKIILVIILLIIIIVGSIIYIKKSKKEINENDIINNKISMGIGEFSEEFLEQVNINEVMQIKSCMDKFLQSTNIKSSAYFGKNEHGELVQLVSDDFIKNKVISFFSENFISDNNVTIENIDKYVKFSSSVQNLNILDIKRIKNEHTDLKQYFIIGDIIIDSKLNRNCKYIITLDNKQRIFSVYPLKLDMDSIEEEKVIDKKIVKNNYNAIPVVSMTQEELSKFYFENMKYMLLYNKNQAYEHLNESYRQERFGSIEEFNNYIENNLEEIETMELIKYKVNANNNDIEYLLVDKYQNIYILNTSNEALKYKIQLDTYTLDLEEFNKAYNDATEKDRVKLNIDKWVKMLNCRDYKTAYNCLDETFRNNNFASEEEFEKYMREKFPLHYKLSVGSTEEVNGLYKQRIILEDITGLSDEKIENTIIMQLKDNYEFVMSFGIE